jgi:hypothetical protein
LFLKLTFRYVKEQAVDNLFTGILPWSGLNARYFLRMIQVQIFMVIRIYKRPAFFTRVNPRIFTISKKMTPQAATKRSCKTCDRTEKLKAPSPRKASSPPQG